MKIRVLSDLHLELCPWQAPAVDADVVVLAGDIHAHTHAIDWAIAVFPGQQIVYVPGNHEFYDAEIYGLRQQLRQRAGDQLHVLDDSAIEIDGVRFLGSTLWTDYKLFGVDRQAGAMHEAKHCMIDHNCIRSAPSGRFLPTDAARLHRKSAAWLATELAKPSDGKTVVVTHHLPSRKSVAERYLSSILSAAFASNLDALVARADLWIHGHTHDSFDYELGGCRVVCNPRGYMRRRTAGELESENPNFDPAKVLTL